VKEYNSKNSFLLYRLYNDSTLNILQQPFESFDLMLEFEDREEIEGIFKGASN